MGIESIYGISKDYNEDKMKVDFEVVDKSKSIELIRALGFNSAINELEFGVEMSLAAQQIPEVIRELSNHNIALYSVIPMVE